jgi:membrane-bound lytic murein transglycosylase B
MSHVCVVTQRSSRARFTCRLQQQTSSNRSIGAGDTAGAPSGGFLLEPQHNVMAMGGDFANNPAAEQFINEMVSKHGFDRQQLHEILSQAKRLDYVLRLMDRQAPTAQRRPRAERRMAALSQPVHHPG